MDNEYAKKSQTIIVILIVILLIVIIFMSFRYHICILGDACEWGVNATATYGAEQFHLQLTEIAK